MFHRKAPPICEHSTARPATSRTKAYFISLKAVMAATITHGNRRVAAVIARDNIIGMQFHSREKPRDIIVEILKST